jgi:hypothetical protein
VVAALILLQDHLAVPTLPEMKISLKEKHSILIALPRMCRHEALLAENDLAYGAENHFLLDIDEAFTVLSGTELQVRVIR